LHFKFQDTETGRNAYYSYLNHLFTEKFKVKYQKNNVDIYQLLEPFQTVALKNAKRLDDSYPASISPYNRDPVTKVYLLVEALSHAGKKNRW